MGSAATVETKVGVVFSGLTRVGAIDLAIWVTRGKGFTWLLGIYLTTRTGSLGGAAFCVIALGRGLEALWNSALYYFSASFKFD
jgi:hypothetical protein